MQKRSSTHGEAFSRRSFLVATAGVFFANLSWSEGSWNSILYWKLNDAGDFAREVTGQVNDPIESRTGHANWVGAGQDRALRLDGYSVWLTQRDVALQIEGKTLTISAWLALETYPVNEAAILHISGGSKQTVSFTIDRWGNLRATVHNGASSSSCRSTEPVRKAEWHHVAAIFDRTGITILINGKTGGYEVANALSTDVGPIADVTVGRSPDCPVVAGEFATGVLNGLLREVHLFKGHLSQADIVKLIDESNPGYPPDLEINRAWCADDPQRPLYHALPPRAWTNEPHGLIHWGGKYHLFYQKNPNGPYWGHINWGHLTSPDLYQWTEMPVALSPEPGPDGEGCWSGSVIDYNGRLAIIYTGGDGHRASICLALSDDGIHFTKLTSNPVIPQPPEGHGFPEFRDPFVWREGDTYYVIIGSAIEGKGGAALLYRSRDLVHWEYRNPLLIGDRETSGVFWEMPVFVKLGDQHALIVCEVPGRASYWIGSWKDETFTPYSMCPQRLELFNHLLSPTPHILGDGRVITLGIIPDERSPKECWRAGWTHLYSLPRLISGDSAGRLHQSPYEGISKWCNRDISLANIDLADGAMKPIEHTSGNCINLHVVFKRGESHSITVRIRSSPDGQEHTDIHYQWDSGRLVLDRTHSSLDPEVKKDTQETTHFPDTSNVLDLDVFIDQSVLEVFVDQRSALAARIYPTLDASSGIFVSCQGAGARMKKVTVARIRPTK